MKETIEQALAFLRGELTYYGRDAWGGYIIEIMTRIITLQNVLRLMEK